MEAISIKEEKLIKIQSFIEKHLEDCVPGQIFTTEVEIASVFGISRPTARKYLDVFCDEGLIERVAGKGIAAASSEKPPVPSPLGSPPCIIKFSNNRRNDK